MIDQLRAALGDAVSTEAAILDAARADRSGHVGAQRPIAVVYAASVEDVQALMRIATEHRVAVVSRGAGTGLAGGSIASTGSIVLDLSRMDRILELRPEDELAVVQAGVINQALSDAARPYGLWYAPDPASKAISTIGGNIATGAGGLLCAKYGVTREAVLSLTAVLADGRIIRTGHRTVKGVTGYDITALLTGSEGTLAVIVEAVVRLQPLPVGEPVTIGAFFPDVVTAAAASAAVTAARLRPAVMELLDGPAVAVISAHLGAEALAGTPLAGVGAEVGAAFLLLQFDGASAPADAEAALGIVTDAGGRAELATDAATGERLLAIRRAFHPALAAQGEVLIEDVSVPRSRMPEMFAAIAAIAAKYGIAIPTVAHAGDGNLHPNFVYDGTVVPQVVPQNVWDAADELFRTALELGGTLTGEHGVGLLKRRWLVDELGEDVYALQRQIKRVFDPLGILNPGKMFVDAAADADADADAGIAGTG